MRFFCDNNISPKIANALGALANPENEVTHLSKKFTPNTPDIKWISEISDDNYVILSGDPRISRRVHEKEALQDSNLTVFFLGKGWMNINIWKQAAGIIKIFPEVIRLAQLYPNKYLFSIDKRGRITQK